MKVIDEKILFEAASEIIKRSCIGIAPDAMELLKHAYINETNAAAKRLLETMIRNAELATEVGKPVCQSPGYPVVYATLGNDIKLETNIQKVFQKAIIELTKKGYLRPSMVHPITRKNPGDNSGIGVPDVEIEYDPNADYVDLIISFKGCGAELANTLKVLTPAQVGREGTGIKKLVLETVANARGIPCPPVAIGIGIGGQIHYAAKLSRKAVSVRKWTDINPNPELATLEKELLTKVNSLGIGPAGIGGDTTALTVKVEMTSTHTAICPVAINFHCWPARRSGIRIHSDGSFTHLL
ncbi:fumarate hydratase [Candidatus Geothermarchaeota archaeon]|nr:MAG: fumarate hydratase [Candidatus Geothermarchaeota archaeon]